MCPVIFQFTVCRKTILQIIVIVFFCTSLFGCFDGDDSGPVQTEQLHEGVFVDSPVEGVTYRSTGAVGQTDENGTFRYVEGEEITFSLGQIVLGRTLPKPVITPLDLVSDAVDESDHQVVNIARLLQSLDDDGVIEQRIKIPQAVREYLSQAEPVNFAQPTDAFTNDPMVRVLFSKLNEDRPINEHFSLVNAEQALAHLREVMKNHPTITLLKPIGNEFISSAPPYEISWKASSSIERVNIYLSADGGLTWREPAIAEEVANTSSFSWFDIPVEPANTQYRIRITDFDDSSVYDQCSGNFTIFSAEDELAYYLEDETAPDTDRDKLPDELEEAIGTDPESADSDKDGLWDYQEVVAGSAFGNIKDLPNADNDDLIAALDNDDNNDGIHDGIGVDSDGDGIDNYLEMNGYTYNWFTDSYSLWDGDPEAHYFKTDPRQVSTDQDPYSDSQEASGKLLDVLIESPGDLPMVPAFPNIVVRLEGYDVTLNADITYAHGGSLAEESNWSRQTTVEQAFEQGINYEIGVEVGVKAGALDWGGAKWSGKVGGSSTWTWTNSASRTFGESITQESNWQKATTSNPATAARVKLKLKVYNLGTAAASNITPTLTLKIGGLSVLTFAPSNPIGILEPGAIYPAQEGTYWVVDKRNYLDVESDIDLTLDELRMLESGAPLNVEVTQMEGDVMLLSSDGQWKFAGKWGEYMARCAAVSANIKLDIGSGNFIHQLVYADDSESAPTVTFGDALRWIAAYHELDKPYISYIDRFGVQQETPLTDWNFIFDNNTLLRNGIVLGDPDASEDVSLLETVLGPDTSVTARAPREALGLMEPEIYFAIFDFDTKVVKVAAADYNGITGTFFIGIDGTRHPMNEVIAGSGVYMLDLSTIDGGYEPVFNEATEEDSDLVERVEVVNRDGTSKESKVFATFSPQRGAGAVEISSITINPTENVLTARIDFDEYFPPTVKIYLTNGAIVGMAPHPRYWEPEYASRWQYHYAPDNRVPGDFKGAEIVAEVDTECTVEPGPFVNGESNCFAVKQVPDSVALEDGSLCRGDNDLRGYFTDTIFAGQIARYDVLDFDDVDLSDCTVADKRLEEEIFWSGFGYDEKWDLALKPRHLKGSLDTYYGAKKSENFAYEDINAGNIAGLASEDGESGLDFFSWSTSWNRSSSSRPNEVWVLKTSGGRYVKIKINYVAATSWPVSTHTSTHAKIFWAIYEP